MHEEGGVWMLLCTFCCVLTFCFVNADPLFKRVLTHGVRCFYMRVGWWKGMRGEAVLVRCARDSCGPSLGLDAVY